MRLSAITDRWKEEIHYYYGESEREIASIDYNSKNVKEKSLFVAIKGFSSDGHNFVREAINKGANTIVISKDRISEFNDLREQDVTILTADNTRKLLSQLSASFFDYPTSMIPVIGITGTNGKTSITFMLESIFKYNGYSPGVIGTVNYRWKDKEIAAPNTTPESKDLQELIHNMISDGVDIAIIEVSSHALQLDRVSNIEFDSAIFTNLTRDHLDLHKTYRDYFNAKKKIFHLLESSPKRNKIGIVNIDDAYGEIIYKENDKFSYPLYCYGIDSIADYKPTRESIHTSIERINYIIENPGIEINLNLSGNFHIANSLCAFALAHRMDIPVEIIQKGLTELNTIPGRFDRIKSRLGFHIIIDYAHTDDALLKLLQSIRELHPKRLITIFGCGGHRDKTKRPLIRKVATKFSDLVIITNDNPRNENPEDIIKDIVSTLNTFNYEIISDREEAIKKGINMAEFDDIIVIAGKGHENYQIIGNKKIHFDDKIIAKKYLTARELK